MNKFRLDNEYKIFKEKNFREVKTYDIIDAEGIRNFALGNREEMTKEKSTFNLFLNEGVIRFPVLTTNIKDISKVDTAGRFISYIYFKKIGSLSENTDTVIMEHYIYDGVAFTFDFVTRIVADINVRILDAKDFSNVEYATLNSAPSKDEKPMSEEEEKRMRDTTIEIFYGVFVAINFLTSKKETITKVVPLKKRNSKNSKTNIDTKQKRTIEILNKDRVLYKIIGSKDTIKSFRTYTRHVDAWSVIGHYRHYKSGKKVWIKPSVRGEGNKIKPKTYKIKEEDDNDGE